MEAFWHHVDLKSSALFSPIQQSGGHTESLKFLDTVETEKL
jgi:hypothetical protein